eukprot:4457917-Pleurochrysis_carterae.AAC.1
MCVLVCSCVRACVCECVRLCACAYEANAPAPVRGCVGGGGSHGGLLAHRAAQRLRSRRVYSVECARESLSLGSRRLGLSPQLLTPAHVEHVVARGVELAARKMPLPLPDALCELLRAERLRERARGMG